MAAPARSWCLSHLALLLALAVPWAFTAENDASKLTCFYNSKANISCVWNWDGALQATSCHIHAHPDRRPWSNSCDLLQVGPSFWACNLILGPPNAQKLTSADVINMTVVCLEGTTRRVMTTQDFKPFENLRLFAPDSLRVAHIGTQKCNITWTVSHSSHYIEEDLEFEVRTRFQGQSWEEASVLFIKQNQQWICLETFLPDTRYELQVRVKPQLDSHEVWSPWSQPLAFRTRPAGKETLSLLAHVMVGLSGACGFIVLVYLLASYRHLGLWLKKVLKCHIPDPSEFFSQLSSEHGGDFQKWLSSPFPSSSFSPSGLAPEISLLEVLDKDAKAAQLLLQQQDKGPSPSLETSGHSLTSCFTNQGYFFFHLPDALEIEACQVYFTYDPCSEEPDEGGSGAPEGSLLPPLPPLPAEDHAYCTFPPGEDLLLFSPSLPVGPPSMTLGGAGASEERRLPSQNEGAPRDWAPEPLRLPTPRAPDPVDCQSALEGTLGEGGEEGPAPCPGEGAGFPWAGPPRQGQLRAPISCLTLNTDAYLSLQELQNQDPAHSP